MISSSFAVKFWKLAIRPSKPSHRIKTTRADSHNPGKHPILLNHDFIQQEFYLKDFNSLLRNTKVKFGYGKPFNSSDHFCFIKDNSIYVWGSSYFSQIPLEFKFSWFNASVISQSMNEDDNSDNPFVPTKVVELEKEIPTKLTANLFNTIVLCQDNKLYSWGSGVLGCGNEIYDPQPKRIRFKPKVIDIKGFGEYTAILAKNDDDLEEVYLFGYFPATLNDYELKALEPIKLYVQKHQEENTNIVGDRNGFAIITTSSGRLRIQLLEKLNANEEMLTYPKYEEKAKLFLKDDILVNDLKYNVYELQEIETEIERIEYNKEINRLEEKQKHLVFKVEGVKEFGLMEDKMVFIDEKDQLKYISLASLNANQPKILNANVEPTLERLGAYKMYAKYNKLLLY